MNAYCLDEQYNKSSQHKDIKVIFIKIRSGKIKITKDTMKELQTKERSSYSGYTQTRHTKEGNCSSKSINIQKKNAANTKTR